MNKNVLKIKPPLIIQKDEADTVLERFRKSFQDGIEITVKALGKRDQLT